MRDITTVARERAFLYDSINSRTWQICRLMLDPTAEHRKSLSVTYQRDFVRHVNEGGEFDIECVHGSEANTNGRGLWYIYAVEVSSGNRELLFKLVKQRDADIKDFQSVVAVTAFAQNTLSLKRVTIPLIAGDIARNIPASCK